MTFSALADPIDIARSHAAVDEAWLCLGAGRIGKSDVELQREALRDIVASYVLVAANDHELVRRSVKGFLSRQRRA